MCKVSDCFRITFILVFYVFLLLNAAQALSIHSKKTSEAYNFLKPLSPEEANTQIALLRSRQKIESCKILFDFVNRTEGNVKATKTQGILLIDSNDQKIFKRLFLIDELGEVLIDYIFHEGDTSQVWKRFGSHCTFSELEDEELFLPLFEGILFRPVDILMPYIHWEKYTYEGPKAYGINNVVHNYLFSSENKPSFLSQGILSVRVSIDSKYNSVQKIEYLNEADVLNQLQISGFKKFESLWIISRLVFKAKNNKTIFRVNDAAIFTADNQSLFFNPIYKENISKHIFFD